MTPPVVAFFLGTSNDWGGASRALLNFVRKLDRSAFTPLVVIPKPGPLETLMPADGIGCEVWPIHERSLNLLDYAVAIVRSASFLRSRNVALIHINYGAIGWKPAEIIAARLLSIPIANHLHTVVQDTSSYISYSSAVIGVSRYVCDHSNPRGAPCYVLHNVADFERFGRGTSKRATLGLRPDSTVVAFFGQVRRIKGVLMFLELARRIDDPNVEFIIAGELRGEDTFQADEFARLIGGDPRVKYLGYRDDIEDLYASCDVVVMPSQWEEPFGMVLLEASAAGRPIVATATGGIPEIVIDGETGFLVEKTDSDALTARVLALIRDVGLRATVGKRAKERAKSTFAFGPVRELEALYRNLIARTGATAL
jgi:glycosyltransferase involved in cell wall biosynthesis